MLEVENNIIHRDLIIECCNQSFWVHHSVSNTTLSQLYEACEACLLKTCIQTVSLPMTLEL